MSQDETTTVADETVVAPVTETQDTEATPAQAESVEAPKEEATA